MNGCVSVCDVNLLKWAWFLCCFYRGWTGMLMLSDNQFSASGWIRHVYVSRYACLNPHKRNALKSFKLLPFRLYSRKKIKFLVHISSLLFYSVLKLCCLILWAPPFQWALGGMWQGLWRCLSYTASRCILDHWAFLRWTVRYMMKRS